MPAERRPPDDAREWLNRARSNLIRAQEGLRLDGVYLEDLCFDAQQAAEKAIKAVLLHLRLRFPYTHDLARLLALLQENGVPFPAHVREAARLTRFAVAARYPGVEEPVSREEYDKAIGIAAEVLRWAAATIEVPPQ